MRLRCHRPSQVSGFQQQTHIIPVERQPLDAVAEHHSRGHQQLCEKQRLDPLILVLLELNPRSGEKLDGVLRVHIFTRDAQTHTNATTATINNDKVRVSAGHRHPDQRNEFQNVCKFRRSTLTRTANRTCDGCHNHGRKTGNVLREVKFKIELPCRCP